MQKNTIYTMFFLFFVCLALPNQTFSQSDESIQSLSGFDTLRVVVEDLNSDLERPNFTTGQIQTEVEIKLRRAGLKVKDKKESLVPPFIYLSIQVNSKYRNGIFSCYIETSLMQGVLLERDKSINIPTKTWETGTLGTVGEEYIHQLQNVVSEQVDKFINDWLKANSSKKQSIKPTYIPPSAPITKQDDSPFTATYVGGNSPPTIEVFNDSNRTMYFDFGQGKMTAYTIPSGSSQKLTLLEGSYNYKASAPRVRNLEGQETFKKGYVYTWRFTIVTVPR